MDGITGKTLKNRYRIDTFIGRGSMAEVYKVWDHQRNVYLAMKLLHEDLAIDRVSMRRFQREAQTLARLKHPNIVRFYSLEQEGRLAFMLLDFIAGKTLKHRIFDAQGPLSTNEIRAILRAVCGALQFSHEKGLVHCDIKPGNIMLDEHGKALLADFGIARLTDAATATMIGVGTPAYMAPEQARGQDPIPQTDIYGLGIVLFEMLTGGERPFTGEQASITGSTSEKVRWEQVHLAPIPPSRFNTQIEPDLEAVVLKCLQKDPAARFSRALDLFNAFDEAVIFAGATLATQPLAPLIDDDGEAPTELESQPFVPVPIPSQELYEAQPPSFMDDDSEAPTKFESRPFVPVPTPPQELYESQPPPSRRLMKWVWPVVIGSVLVLLGIFIFSPGIGLPTFSPIRTSAVANLPDTKLPDTLVPEAEEPTAENLSEVNPAQATYTPQPTYTDFPTYTQPPPRNTSRPSATESAPIATEYPTITPQLEKPYLVADKNYFCRQSPNESAEEHWIFLEGSENMLLGKSNTDWWLIAVDDPSTRTKCCWVGDGAPGGELSILPLITFEIDRMNCPSFP